MKPIVAIIVTLSLGASAFAADVIISEIMYNPASREGRTGDNPLPCMTEWVELYNTTGDEVNLTGWTLADEDGSSGAFPEGTTLAGGAALVVIPVECDEAKFKEAWGDDVQIVAVSGWGRGGLSQLGNSPSDVNEVLEVRDAEGAAIDVVNFDDEGAWPRDEPGGPSIYLKPEALDADANDDGTNWARSVVDTHGAKANMVNDVFNGKDVGSPGVVATE